LAWGKKLTYYIFKLAITTVLIVLIAELAKRSSFAGAVVASIPLVSVLAMIWLYIDTKDVDKVSALSASVFWLVLPSLVLFIAMPILLRLGLPFYPSLSFSIGLTVAAYWLMVIGLNQFGIKL
jgi:hypothetical protein